MHRARMNRNFVTLAAGAVAAAAGLSSHGAVTEAWLVQRPAFIPSATLTSGAGEVIVVGTQYNATGTASSIAVDAFNPVNGQIAWHWDSGFVGDAADDASIDGSGNIYIAGRNGASWKVVKLTPAHQVAFARTLVPAGQQIADDVPYRIVPDGSGGAYVVGYTLGPAEHDARITRVNNLGSVMWTRSPGIDERWDRFYSVVLTPQGPVACGEVGDDEADGRVKFAVVAFDPAGTQRWSQYRLGTWPEDRQGFFEDGIAWSIVADAAGNVYAGGLVGDDLQYNDMYLMKITPAGVASWTRQWDGPNGGLYDRAYAMALDNQQQVYMTGESFNSFGHNYFDIPLVSYDSAGTFRWQSVLNSASNDNDSEDVADNIFIDEAGRIIVIGSDWTKPGFDYIVQVFSPEGTLITQTMVDTPNQQYNVHGERCAALLPGGRLAFAAKAGGFGTLNAGTATVGLLNLNLVGACRGDFNRDGSVSVQDIFDFLSAYFAASPSADVNGSGGVTVQDVFDYLVLYFAGC